MNVDMPKLPAEISPDGREIWDWASKLSDLAQRRDDERRLAHQIRIMETTCGSCSHWMTRSCPGERHNNKGRSIGPSSLSPKCGRFDMNGLTLKELVSAKEKLAAMTATQMVATCTMTDAPCTLKCGLACALQMDALTATPHTKEPHNDPRR